MSFDVDLSEVKPLFAAARSIFTPSVADEILLIAGRRVGVAAEGLVSEYPPASGNPLPLFYTRVHVSGPDKGKSYQSKFKSQAQQKLVMALAARGKLPYRRTGTLGKSVTSHPDLVGAGVVMIRVGSNLSYAAYVLDRLMQSHYFIGVWRTIDQDIEDGLPMLRTVAVKSIMKQINMRLSK